MHESCPVLYNSGTGSPWGVDESKGKYVILRYVAELHLRADTSLHSPSGLCEMPVSTLPQ